MKRTRLIAALRVLAIFLVSFAAFSCGGGSAEKDPSSPVTVLYIGDERIFFQEYWGMEASYWIFEPLVTRTGDDRGEIRPALATRWEHSDDYKIWTFYLRDDVKWHDGKPVTAHDIKFTMDLRNDPVVNPEAQQNYSVEVIDDHTVKVAYDEPTDARDTYFVYYPKHLLEKLDRKDFFKWDFWTSPVGNGPYKFVRSVPKTMVEVEANPDYYGKVPEIKRAVLKFSDTPNLAELLSGNVDALSYVSGDMAMKISRDDRYRVYHWWGRWIESIYWNHKNPLFSSPSVRKALTMAVNRKELAQILNNPPGVPILDVVTTERQFRNSAFPEPLKYDPEEARRLLGLEGWKDEDGDGALEKDGRKFSFTLTVNGQLQNTAIYVQDQLRKIGVETEIQTVENSVYRQKHRSGEYEALVHQFDNPRWINMFFKKDSPFGYENEEMLGLVEKARVTIDEDAKDKVFEEIMAVMQRDMPVTFLVPRVQFHVADKRIKGLSSPDRPDPVWFMPTLTFEN